MPIKSPFNYIGNKYRIIEAIQRFFPRNIDNFVDLFCGGCDVCINTNAHHVFANDINHHIIAILQEFQRHSIDYILAYIDQRIDEWGLSKDNEQGYLAFRAFVNREGSPLDLYTLMNFSFNYQFRFNSKQQYNNTFGRNRSSFNDSIRANLIEFRRHLDHIVFSSIDFLDFNYDILKVGDFIYADPPYLLTCGSYNDGKRGFRGWSYEDDASLRGVLDMLSERGVLFALSNVIEHKGKRNIELLQWARQNHYHIHGIQFNYDNCNYQTDNRNHVTKEVLITNY